MRQSIEAEKKQEREKIAAYAVNHLPIVKEFAMKLGLVEIINNLIPSEMNAEPVLFFSD